ncbi:MAG: TIGR04211 family SH3 domain-containing protein, partial [Pseudomonadota bacterium]
MGRTAALLFAAAAPLLAPPVTAETRYVTDVLRLELTAEPDGAGPALTQLVSGAELEVLESRRYYARVQTTDGQLGWVKAGYLTPEKPAQARLRELETAREALASTVESLQSDLSRQAASLSEAQAGRDAAERTSAASAAELGTLRAENRELRDQAAAFRYSVPLKWLLGVSAVTLLGGFVAGLAW